MEPFERVCRVATLRLSLVAGLLLPIGAAAATVKGEVRKVVVVRCEMGETIGRALAKLDKASPSTVRVSGTCQENVLVRGFEDLMIVGNVGATLVAVPFDPIPSPPDSTYALEILAARTVAIEGLTIRVTDGRPAMIFAACQDCHVKNVTVDGGIGFYAFDWTSVFFSRLKVTGAAGGAWAAAGAWKASLWIEDSVFEDTGPSNEVRWCGLCVGQGTVVNVLRSAFRNFGVGLGADTSASVFMQEAVTIEDNWCYGAQGTTGAHLTIGQGSKVLNNSNICWSGGINLDSGATLGISGNTGTGQVLVSGNTGGGIRLNHHAFAQIGSGTVISTNNGPGVDVRNLSIAVGPGPANPPDPTQNAVITGNQWGGDLACSSISHINNCAQITASQVQCVNAWPGDGPP